MIDAASMMEELLGEPWDAPWARRYAPVADPDGYRVDLFCPLPT